MRKLLPYFLCLLTFAFCVGKSFAVENPLSLPNNKFGIHILFTSEIGKAAELVNSNGGDWGYVLIPIQAGDKDLEKWQTFMDDCRKYHIIPLIRLATENYYFNTQVWRKPDNADVLDFANFLSSLDWPTKNRYVIVFNEVNRGDEWGGNPNPVEYANILSYAVTAFKSKSPDFFIVSAGMDNAAANANNAMNEYNYFPQMDQAVPGIFNQIDGFGSHSYPNPAFTQPPWVNTRMSIASFTYEKSLLESLSSKSLPVFITETGWSQDIVGKDTTAAYFQQALNGMWNNANIVAITPFLLEAGTPPFSSFSFLDPSGNPNPVYTTIKNLQKIKGAPTLNPSVLSAHVSQVEQIPTQHFSQESFFSKQTQQMANDFKYLFKWLLRMN